MDPDRLPLRQTRLSRIRNTGSAQMERRRRNKQRHCEAMPLPSVGWNKGVIFVSSCCLCFGLIILSLAKQHIKKRWNNFLAYPVAEALALPLSQNKQYQSPRFGYIADTLYANHGRRTLRYCGVNFEFARFSDHRKNAITTSFSICRSSV